MVQYTDRYTCRMGGGGGGVGVILNSSHKDTIKHFEIFIL